MAPRAHRCDRPVGALGAALSCETFTPLSALSRGVWPAWTTSARTESSVALGWHPIRYSPGWQVEFGQNGAQTSPEPIADHRIADGPADRETPPVVDSTMDCSDVNTRRVRFVLDDRHGEAVRIRPGYESGRSSGQSGRGPLSRRDLRTARPARGAHAGPETMLLRATAGRYGAGRYASRDTP